MVDAKHVGLVGHSWGGYETTFILTQSNLFAAGVAGGPLTNLSSSYGEIYWNSGGPETNHVEVGQERMEVPLYEDPQAYIRNSAVYFANKLPRRYCSALAIRTAHPTGTRISSCITPPAAPAKPASCWYTKARTTRWRRKPTSWIIIAVSMPGSTII